MKKLIALLAVCSVFTFSFASCGHDEEDKATDAAESSASAEESSEEETETEASQEETTAETTEESEEETTGEETSSDDEESISEGGSGRVEITPDGHSNELVGYWLSDDDSSAEFKAGCMFDDYGFVSVLMDISPVLSFTDGDTFSFGGEEFPASDIEIDGDMLSLTDEDGYILNFIKTDDGDGGGKFDGIYLVEDSAFKEGLDEIAEEYDFLSSADLMYVEIDGERTILYFADVGEYSIDGDKLTVTDAGPMFGSDNKDTEATFKLDGDKLIITSEKGVERTFVSYQ